MRDALRMAAANKTLVLGLLVLGALALMAAFAPILATNDPLALNPANRLRPPSGAAWFGTDMLGRDIFSRTVHGARYSLLVGASVALLSAAVGTAIGLVTGYDRIADAIIMRIVDGLMAIPPVLVAIGLMSVTSAGAGNVIAAITVAETPRIIRLVRSVVLSLKAQSFVEAAIASGTRPAVILWRHILPNVISPLVVQTTFAFGAAILIEATLSFIGAGIPPEIPTWGNIIAEGRNVFLISQHAILFPGAFIAVTVLAANMIGDGLRDLFDPRQVQR